MRTRQEEKLHPEEMPHFNPDDPRLSSVGWSHSQRCGFGLKLKTCKKQIIVGRSGFSAAHLSEGSDHWPEVGNKLYHFNQLTKNGDVQWMCTQHVTQAIGGSLPCRSLVYIDSSHSHSETSCQLRRRKDAMIGRHWDSECWFPCTYNMHTHISQVTVTDPVWISPRILALAQSQVQVDLLTWTPIINQCAGWDCRAPVSQVVVVQNLQGF